MMIVRFFSVTMILTLRKHLGNSRLTRIMGSKNWLNCSKCRRSSVDNYKVKARVLGLQCVDHKNYAPSFIFDTPTPLHTFLGCKSSVIYLVDPTHIVMLCTNSKYPSFVEFNPMLVLPKHHHRLTAQRNITHLRVNTTSQAMALGIFLKITCNDGSSSNFVLRSGSFTSVGSV